MSDATEQKSLGDISFTELELAIAKTVGDMTNTNVTCEIHGIFNPKIEVSRSESFGYDIKDIDMTIKVRQPDRKQWESSSFCDPFEGVRDE